MGGGLRSVPVPKVARFPGNSGHGLVKKLRYGRVRGPLLLPLRDSSLRRIKGGERGGDRWCRALAYDEMHHFTQTQPNRHYEGFVTFPPYPFTVARSLARLLVRSPRLDMARLQIIRKNRADAAEKKALLADAAAEKKAAAGRR